MASELIISASGLRGIVGRSLTPEVAWRYAAAFAAGLPAGPIVIARDGRANGAQLLRPVLAGLSQGGTPALLEAGIAATPTTGVLVRQHRCAGGVQITASHNPAEYNGLKLFSAAGRVVPGDVGRQVLERYRAGKSISVGGNAIYAPSGAQSLTDTTSAHWKLVEQTVDTERIRARRFRVLLDANHGSGSVLGRLLLERLGCDVTVLGGEPDGQFAHPPEPTADNLAGVPAIVTQSGADVGFCQDPDADRVAMIDERGRYLGEEHTLALCVDHVLRHSAGPVVTNCATSRMTEDLACKYGVSFYRSAVGEANVVDLMLRHRAVLGGEGSGGVIDPRVGMVRDSFVGVALVLSAMAERGEPISRLADELPRYAIWKTKIKMPRERAAVAINLLEHKFRDAVSDRLDGLRLDWDDAAGHRWLLVRASNTEPIVRAIAEAPTVDQAQRLCDQANRILRRLTPDP